MAVPPLKLVRNKAINLFSISGVCWCMAQQHKIAPNPISRTRRQRETRLVYLRKQTPYFKCKMFRETWIISKTESQGYNGGYHSTERFIRLREESHPRTQEEAQHKYETNCGLGFSYVYLLKKRLGQCLVMDCRTHYFLLCRISCRTGQSKTEIKEYEHKAEISTDADPIQDLRSLPARPRMRTP